VLRIRDALAQVGVRTELSRDNDNALGPCNDQRAAMANVMRPEAIVSIHADGGPPSGRGFHVNYSSPPLNDAQAGPPCSWRPSCGRRQHSHRSCSDDLSSVIVAHPFHPLRGERLAVLFVKRRGTDVVFVCAGAVGGQVTLPHSWTDRSGPALAQSRAWPTWQR
jgi:N-acetylmuramoyl-L-alanine amidase